MHEDQFTPEKNQDAPEKFEPLLARLEQAVRELEDGRLSLDESLKRYTEAVELYRRCRSMLDGAQKRVEILLEETKGELKVAPFEVDVEDQSPE